MPSNCGNPFEQQLSQLPLVFHYPWISPRPAFCTEWNSEPLVTQLSSMDSELQPNQFNTREFDLGLTSSFCFLLLSYIFFWYEWNMQFNTKHKNKNIQSRLNYNYLQFRQKGSRGQNYWSWSRGWEDGPRGHKTWEQNPWWLQQAPPHSQLNGSARRYPSPLC